MKELDSRRSLHKPAPTDPVARKLVALWMAALVVLTVVLGVVAHFAQR